MNSVQTTQPSLRWPGFAYGAIAVVACAFAFVGLSTSSFWIDELFTLYVINHHGGLAEVFRRALTDVHPPLYYFFLYGWTQLFGISEWSVRLPSAICAVLAVALFAHGARRIASGSAVAFACAVATVSIFWFDQSQNARSYMFALALATGLLNTAMALHRRKQSRPGLFPGWHLTLLTALGLAASFTHAYLLLATGMVWLFLLLSTADLRLRVALLVTGLLILLPNLLYYYWLTHSTQLDLHNLWFKNSVGFFRNEIRHALTDLLTKYLLILLAALLLCSWLLRRWRGTNRAPLLPISDATRIEARWCVGLCLVVLVGVVVCGISVSILVAPSFSDRNLLSCVPFAWLLLAKVYDAAGPRRRSLGGAVAAVLVVLMLCSQLMLLQGRWLPRTEPWRASAAYVAQQPGCTGQIVPVVLPFNFSRATPRFRTLSEQNFFGYYLAGSEHLRAYTPEELAGPNALPEVTRLLDSRAESADRAGDCQLLTWGVHDLEKAKALQMAAELVQQPQFAQRSVVVQEFVKYNFRRWFWVSRPAGFVFLVEPRHDTDAHPARKAPHASNVLGDRIVVSAVPNASSATESSDDKIARLPPE